MKISDAAVEAAARASWERSNSDPWISGDHDDIRWHDRREYIEDARATLEAAAPHLMAQAWQEGHTTGDGDAFVTLEARESGRPEECADVVTPNPYRSAGAGE